MPLEEYISAKNSSQILQKKNLKKIEMNFRKFLEKKGNVQKSKF